MERFSEPRYDQEGGTLFCGRNFFYKSKVCMLQEEPTLKFKSKIAFNQTTVKPIIDTFMFMNLT